MKCHHCGKTTPPYAWVSGNLSFCSFSCFETYQGKEDKGWCVGCHRFVEQEETYSDFYGHLKHHCSETYQGKEKVMSMTYRGHTVTVKMYITPPNGSREMFDMPASTFEHEAKTEIDKMIPDVRCSHCEEVIEPGALYIKARFSTKRFCCLRCYNTSFPVAEGIPELKRLDSAPKAE